MIVSAPVHRTIDTGEAPAVVDVTEEVRTVLAGSRVSWGRATVSTPAGSCSLVVNEKESGLMADMAASLRRVAGATPAQPHGLIGSSSVVLPVAEATLRLGTWQRVLLLDLEGGARRLLVVQIVGE